MTQLVSKAVGIDLGTTNSAVAVMDPTDGELLIHSDPVTKSPTTPSCVWHNAATGEIVVGRKAYARKGSAPEPVSSVKRLMGTGDTVRLAGEELSPAQVSARILEEMKRQIEADVAGFDRSGTRWIVDRAVVTVPAYFDQPQIAATREAAELAGLEVVGLLHEPTAAASYHCWRTATTDGTFLVYDFGGGTFDVSVLRCTSGAFEVLGLSGHNLLGGDDIDAAIARHLQRMLQADGWKLDLDPTQDPEDRYRAARLRQLAEGAKKALSQSHEYMLRENGQLIDKAGDPVAIEALLERAEIEEIARPFIERTFPYCDVALERAQERAGITLADVDQVILAGGSTHMPLVRDLVTRELCGRPAADLPRRERAKCAEPVYEQVDTVVALGAAVRAAAVGGLAVYDEDRRVRISLRGTGRTGAERLNAGGTVEALAPEVELADGRVVLTAGQYEDETELDGGSFAFKRIPLQPDAETELTFEVFDAAGRPLAAARRTVARTSREQIKPLDPVNATPNSKTIKLEVLRGDQTERYPLVPALENLPFARDYEFRHPGGVDRVELRLYQESRPIQVITVPVPASTPKDTPILMHVVMHENYAITVDGSIGDTPYEAQVHPPAERELPTDAEIGALRTSFEENLSVLSAGQRAAVTARFTLAHQAYTEARDRGDVRAATHERDELETILGSIAQAETELRPTKPEFDDLLRDCLQLHAHFARHGVPEGRPFDADENAQLIEELRRLGERAYTNRDQLSYQEAVRKLEAVYDYLLRLGHSAQSPTISAAERAQALVTALLSAARKLREQARNVQDAASERDLADLADRVAKLEPQIAANPQHVLEEGGKLASRLRQLQKVVTKGDSSDGPAVNIPVL